MDIKNKNLYYIGGVVRDEILGKESLDIDLTYNGDAIEFAKQIENAEIVRINEPFGTVRIRLNNKEIDIASTRSEIYPVKGHLPVVDKIGCSLKEDVMRRDFTINAMAKSTLTGEIIDYTGGLQDLKDKKLRVLHDKSFIDDPTRIVRALKFGVRFGFELEEHSKQLQIQYLRNINYDMSFKRLKKELIETFNLNSAKAFELFVEQKIYKLISTQDFSLKADLKRLELFINKYIITSDSNPDKNFEGKSSNIWLIYIGLLPDISNLALTKSERKIVEEYKKMLNSTPNPKVLLNENVTTEAMIMYSTVNPEFSQLYLDKFRHIKLEINGENLKELGIPPSEKYKECFDYILDKKLKNSEITKNDEIRYAKDFFSLN